MKTKNIKPIEEVLRSGNDGKNQSIKEKFVDREVFCNVNTLVEYILNAGHEDRNAPFTVDDVENYYSYPEYRGDFASFDGGTDEDRQTEIERLRDLQSDLYDKIQEIEDQNGEAAHSLEKQRAQIEEEIEELENLETEAQEVFEWWAVSSFLYDKLKELGHPVLDAGSCYVWGRCTTGQAILLDYAITKICANMGILAGQENEWSV